MPPSKKRRGPDGDTVIDDSDDGELSIDDIDIICESLSRRDRDDVQAFKNLALDSYRKEVSNEASNPKNKGHASRVRSGIRGMAIVEKFRTGRRKKANNTITNLDETEPAHLELKARLRSIITEGELCDGEVVDHQDLNPQVVKTIFKDEKGDLTPSLVRSTLRFDDWSDIEAMPKPAVLAVLRYISGSCDNCAEKLDLFRQSVTMKYLKEHELFHRPPDQAMSLVYTGDSNSLTSLQLMLGCYCNVPGVIERINREKDRGMKFCMVDEGLDCWTAFPPTSSHQMPPLSCSCVRRY